MKFVVLRRVLDRWFSARVGEICAASVVSVVSVGGLVVATCSLIAFWTPAAFGDAPLAVRNTAPIANLYGLPRMLGAELVKGPGLAHRVSLDIGNNFTSRSRGNTQLVFDGETVVAAYQLRAGLSDSFEIAAEIPYVIHYGGIFDGFIDNYHDLLGLPDGNRPSQPRDRLFYAVRVDGVDYVDVQSSTQRLGDARVSGGYQWFATEDHALALRAQIKAPTGDADRLTGSGAWDVAAWAEYGANGIFGVQRLGVSIGVGGVFLAEGDIAPDAQNTFTGIGHFGLNYEWTDIVHLNAQVDAHGDLWDRTQNGLVREAGVGVQGTLGGRVRLAQSTWLDIAVIEDLQSDSSSDVVFQFAVSSQF